MAIRCTGAGCTCAAVGTTLSTVHKLIVHAADEKLYFSNTRTHISIYYKSSKNQVLHDHTHYIHVNVCIHDKTIIILIPNKTGKYVL